MCSTEEGVVVQGKLTTEEGQNRGTQYEFWRNRQDSGMRTSCGCVGSLLPSAASSNAVNREC